MYKRQAQGELDALNGKRLGVATGSVFDQVALERLPEAQVSYFNAQPDIVTALLAGKVDAMITDEPMARDIVSQAPGLRLIPDLLYGSGGDLRGRSPGADLRRAPAGAHPGLPPEGPHLLL